ncbi:MAG: hypothetical protein COA57_05075 [Flavobacteriales bacterium]|nr:MAG: hypothetical protein COA57_05075 [Flavobacteriales bacterium]
MPLEFIRNITSTGRLGMWRIEETVDELVEKTLLSEKEKNQIASLKTERIKTQKLATRALLGEMLGKEFVLEYDKNGKPHLAGNAFKISISHSNELVAVMLDEEHETGVDIQKITPKVDNIKHKFLSNKELENSSKSNLFEQLHVYWGAKEALYKVYGRKELIFKVEIRIEDFEYKNQGEITGHIEKKDYKNSWKLGYENLNDYMLVYVLHPIDY